jgi:hypothetical protein
MERGEDPRWKKNTQENLLDSLKSESHGWNLQTLYLCVQSVPCDSEKEEMKL